jgi:hypothetical protein
MTTRHDDFFRQSCALLLAMLLLLGGWSTAHAQPAIPWQTVDGGGGLCTAGAFTLRGTVGQADAGVMSGGQFSLAGGFWQSPAPSTGTMSQRLYMPFIRGAP